MSENQQSFQGMDSAEDLRDWNRSAAAYGETKGVAEDRIYRQFKSVLWECLGEVQGLDVLELGCGHGWLSKEIHAAGARVGGIDGSTELLKLARNADPGVEFVEYDLTLGLPQRDWSFDRVVANMVLMDVPEIGPVVRAVRQVLKPEGRFVFTMPHPCFFNYKSRRDESTGQTFKAVTGYLKFETWRIGSFGGHNHYHRSLTTYFDCLRANRLAVTRLYEPPHIPGPNAIDPEFFKSIPIFLLIEAMPFEGKGQ